MAQLPPNSSHWVPGQPGKAGPGRPKGSKNRKTLLREELDKHGSELAAVIKEKALAGDPTCISLWVARLDPPIRARGETVEFEFSPDATPAQQIAQVMKGIAQSELTVEEGKQFVEMIRHLAEVRALENSGSTDLALIEAFKQVAMSRDPVVG